MVGERDPIARGATHEASDPGTVAMCPGTVAIVL